MEHLTSVIENSYPFGLYLCWVLCHNVSCQNVKCCYNMPWLRQIWQQPLMFRLHCFPTANSPPESRTPDCYSWMFCGEPFENQILCWDTSFLLHVMQFFIFKPIFFLLLFWVVWLEGLLTYSIFVWAFSQMVVETGLIFLNNFPSEQLLLFSSFSYLIFNSVDTKFFHLSLFARIVFATSGFLKSNMQDYFMILQI